MLRGRQVQHSVGACDPRRREHTCLVVCLEQPECDLGPWDSSRGVMDKTVFVACRHRWLFPLCWRLPCWCRGVAAARFSSLSQEGAEGQQGLRAAGSGLSLSATCSIGGGIWGGA